jgi:exodeoxyribonuclease-1
MITEPTFFFYDLETSGIEFATQRIMQFAGIRTTMALEQIGQPVNVLIRLSDDILPTPMAIAITGITPQQTKNGLTEAAFVELLQHEICTPGTIMTGYNSVRFDDEFLRYTLYRNLCDPYAWAHTDGRSRWDLLDVVRLTRALRPDGIEWGIDEAGDPINTLVSLSSTNDLVHAKAHDALSDVQALIAVSRLIRDKQPRLFDFLLKLRSKHEVAAVIKPFAPEPFVYTSVMYGRAHQFTTVAVVIGEGEYGSSIVYDLRHDPAEFAGLTEDELCDRLYGKTADLDAAGLTRPPIKTLHANRCPAVAPLGTLDPAAAERIDLRVATALANLTKLQHSGLIPGLVAAATRKREFEPRDNVDGELYGGFIGDSDKRQMAEIIMATPEQLAHIKPKFSDKRLPELFWRYRARNYPLSLSTQEEAQWDSERAARLQAGLPAFTEQFQEVLRTATPKQATALEDLRLWVGSIIPVD